MYDIDVGLVSHVYAMKQTYLKSNLIPKKFVFNSNLNLAHGLWWHMMEDKIKIWQEHQYSKLETHQLKRSPSVYKKTNIQRVYLLKKI